MTTSLAAQGSPALALAEVDPALRHLEAALARAEGAGWQRHDARWAPGEGCRLAFRAPGRAGAVTAFHDVRVGPDGVATSHFLDDGGLPGLSTALDPGAVSARLAPLFGGRLRCTAEPVRYRAGSRCVVRYDVQVPQGQLTLFAKVLSHDGFRAVSSVADTLAAAPSLAGAVPGVVAVWPDLQAVVVRGAVGRSGSAVLGDPDVAGVEREALAGAVGRLLAVLHRHEGLVVPAFTPTDQLATLAQQLRAVEVAAPRLGEKCAEVVAALARTVPFPATPVLAHGGFRAGQLVVGADGHLTLLDLDGLCRGDGGRDLGALLAHLAWQGLRVPQLQEALEAAGSTVVSAYEETAGPVAPESLRWWRAAGLLQVAARRFRRLETQSWGLAASLVDAAQDLVAEQPGPLPALLDGPRLTALLRAGLQANGPEPAELEVDATEELTMVAGRRSVVRCTVRGLDGPAPVAIVGKSFSEPLRARLLHEHLRLLSEAVFVDDDLRVPEPLALLADDTVVLYRCGEGTPVSLLPPGPEALTGVEQAARWLARLHTSSVVLPRALSHAQERASTRVWADLVAAAHPEHAEAAHLLARGWADAMPTSPARQVPLHKDFHPGHVLVGSSVCVVDLDEARQGDPAFDVAHFCAYLEAFGADDGSLAGAFVDTYAAATGWRGSETLPRYAAYAWLKIARQWAGGTGPCRGSTSGERAAGVARALTRGVTWLSG